MRRLQSHGTGPATAPLPEAGREAALRVISYGDGGFVEEQRNPFAGGLPVLGRATAEFVATVEMADQFGGAPVCNEPAPPETEVFKNVHRFHATSVAWGGGQLRG